MPVSGDLTKRTPLLREIGEIPAEVETEEKRLVTTCTIDCGGRCPLSVRVKNGIVTGISVYDDNKIPPLKACIRGLNYHYRVYAPQRLKYPLIRVGERGSGRFRRISWEEALTIVADEMKRIKAKCSPEAIFECTCSGSNFCLLHPTQFGALYNLLNSFGGRTAFGTSTSGEGAVWTARFTYGITDSADANSYSDLVNSKLIISWGWNPVENHSGTDTLYWLKQARDRGIKFVSVDPCYTDTARFLKAEWIPIRPSTDTAMLIAMAYVLLSEGLCDKEFVARYVFGFDRYRDYVLGVTDGIPKTPEWASKITGVPAVVIGRLAREYASAKPAALIQAVAPGRTANGEQYHRAATALQAISGNMGVSGGSGHCLSGSQCKSGFEKIQNPYLQSRNPHLRFTKSRLIYGGEGVEIKKGNWAEAVLKGKAGGYPSDIKMIYVVGHNILTSRANVCKGVEAFKKVEFVVCQDQFLTPTARYSDIVLPANTNFERDDIATAYARGNYVIFVNKAIDSLWESKSDRDIARELAKKLGIDDFDTRTDEEWLRSFFEQSDLKKEMTYEEFKKQGLVRLEAKPFIAFKEEREDPEHHPFPTPSGKIEIYAQQLDTINPEVRHYSSVISTYQDIPRIPTFVPCDELPASPKARQYPLQLTTPHHTHRAHSQFYNIPRLRQMYRHEVWINPADAEARGIADGDQVHIFNERGTIQVVARVTERMMPGVVRCYEGGWYEPDENGVDVGGCVNVLLDDMLTSPGGATNSNTCLVDIKKV